MDGNRYALGQGCVSSVVLVEIGETISQLQRRTSRTRPTKRKKNLHRMIKKLLDSISCHQKNYADLGGWSARSAQFLRSFSGPTIDPIFFFCLHKKKLQSNKNRLRGLAISTSVLTAFFNFLSIAVKSLGPKVYARCINGLRLRLQSKPELKSKEEFADD